MAKNASVVAQKAIDLATAGLPGASRLLSGQPDHQAIASALQVLCLTFYGGRLNGRSLIDNFFIILQAVGVIHLNNDDVQSAEMLFEASLAMSIRLFGVHPALVIPTFDSCGLLFCMALS